MGTSTSPAQPEKIGPETRVRWYIENTGSPRLGEELSKLRDGGAECFEHRDMKCLDRQGKPIERNLYEVKK